MAEGPVQLEFIDLGFNANRVINFLPLPQLR